MIKPALADGVIVLCDRYADSTTVYQGCGRGLDKKKLRDLNDLATDGLKPHLTLLFHLSPELAAERLQGPERANEQNRMDKEGVEFQTRVSDGFAAEAKLEPDRWVMIDASLPQEKVADLVFEAVASKMA